MGKTSPTRARAMRHGKIVAEKEKAPRAPSAYNLFMKSELAKVKKANPKLDHKEAFTKAAANWSSSKDNPKNKK